MGSLVLELQQRALDPSVAPPDLVRMALTVATKLGVEELRRWAENELRGYAPGAELPRYRQLTGVLKAFNPFRGWIPVLLHERIMEAVGQAPYKSSLAELDALLASKGDNFQVVLAPELQQMLIELTGERMEFALHLPRARLAAIAGAVRDAVLEWALELEKRGVLGEGMTFTERERQAAHTTHISIGTMHSSQLMSGSAHGQQQLRIQHPQLDLEGVRRLVERLKDNRSELGLSAARDAEMNAEVMTLEAQLASPAPKQTIVTASLDAIRRLLEGATASVAGNLLDDVLRHL